MVSGEAKNALMRRLATDSANNSQRRVSSKNCFFHFWIGLSVSSLRAVHGPQSPAISHILLAQKKIGAERNRQIGNRIYPALE
jgi:hypothetical protein